MNEDSVSNVEKVVEQPKKDTVKKEAIDKKRMTPEKIKLSEPPEALYSFNGKDIATCDAQDLYMRLIGKEVNFKLNELLSKKNNRIYESGVYKVDIIISPLPLVK